MDFKERLIRNDMRNFAEHLRAVSEELILLQAFVHQEFGDQFRKFLRSRKHPTNDTDLVINSPLLPKVRILDMDEPMSAHKRRSRSYRDRKHRILQAKETLKNTNIASTEATEVDADEDDVEFCSVYPDIKDSIINADVNDDDNEDCSHSEDGNFDLYPITSLEVQPNASTKNECNPNPNLDENDPFLSDINEEDNEDPEDANDSDFDPFNSSDSKSKISEKHLQSATKRKQSPPAQPSSKSRKCIQFNCPICGSNQPSLFKLKDHVLSEHSEDEAFENRVCVLCCEKYSTQEIFMLHLDVAHKNCTSSNANIKGKGSNKCSYCEKVCDGYKKRMSHERTHTGEKPYKCEFCDQTFTVYSSVTRHIQRKHTESKS